MKIWLFPIIPLIVAGCSRISNNVSVPEVKYHFEIQSPLKSSLNQGMITFLETELPKQKYGITNESGKTWPYYESFSLQEKVHPERLMPPHSFVHRLVKRSPSSEIKMGEYVVIITLMPKPDTLVNYSVTIFLQQPDGLEKTGEGIHFMDTTKTSQPWLAELNQSVVRYSFK